MVLKRLPFALYTSPLSVQALRDSSCLSYVSCYNGVSPWFTLYELGTDRIENTAMPNNYLTVLLLWRHVFVFRGNMFSLTFPSDGHLISLHCSGFSPHITIFYLPCVVFWIQRNIQMLIRN
jgi:hypothetical protein